MMTNLIILEASKSLRRNLVRDKSEYSVRVKRVRRIFSYARMHSMLSVSSALVRINTCYSHCDFIITL